MFKLYISAAAASLNTIDILHNLQTLLHKQCLPFSSKVAAAAALSKRSILVHHVAKNCKITCALLFPM